ncbi:MAG TPA: hypothetical protein VGD64_02945 [Acidisarcina sp.]
MAIMSVLWTMWALVTASLLILLGYRGTLTRYEGDQIYLDESSSNHEQDQATLMVRLSRLQPFVRVATAITCLLSTAILGTYVWDAVHQFTM